MVENIELSTIPTRDSSPASHLLWGGYPLLVFPRAQFWLDERTGQDQLIVGHRHDQTPPLEVLWCPQACFLPQQGLFVKQRLHLRWISIPVIGNVLHWHHNQIAL